MGPGRVTPCKKASGRGCWEGMVPWKGRRQSGASTWAVSGQETRWPEIWVMDHGLEGNPNFPLTQRRLWEGCRNGLIRA